MISISTKNIIDLLIKQCEGIRLKAYRDVTDVLTIGIGLARIYPNGRRIEEWDTCTEEQAYDWLNFHLENCVFPSLLALSSKYPIPTEVFESLCCFVYNEGANVLKSPSILDAIQSANWGQFADAMRQYNKVRINGQLTFSQGLANRREIEIDNFKSLITN